MIMDSHYFLNFLLVPLVSFSTDIKNYKHHVILQFTDEYKVV